MKSIIVSGNNAQVSTCDGKPIKEITIDGVTYTRDISKLDPVQCDTSVIQATYSTNSTGEVQTSETVRIGGFLGNIVRCDASIKSLTQGDSSKIRVTADAASTQWDSTHTIATQEYVTVNFFISGASNKYVGTVELNTASQPAAYDRVNVDADDAISSTSHLYYSACTVGFDIQRTYVPDVPPVPTPDGAAGAVFCGSPVVDDISVGILNSLRGEFGDEYVANANDGTYSDWKDYVSDLVSNTDASPDHPVVVVVDNVTTLGYNYGTFVTDLISRQIDTIEDSVAYLFYAENISLYESVYNAGEIAANSVMICNAFPGNEQILFTAFVNDYIAGDESSWFAVVPEHLQEWALESGIDYEVYGNGDDSSCEQYIANAFSEGRYLILPVTSEAVNAFNNTYSEYAQLWAASCLMQTSDVLTSTMNGMLSNCNGNGEYWFTVPDGMEIGEAITASAATFSPGIAYTEYISMDGNSVIDISSYISW